MTPDDDPLWYDRVEPDEPLNVYVMVLLGAFAVAEIVCIGVMELYGLLRGGTALAFRGGKP